MTTGMRIVSTLLGVMFTVGAFTMSSYSWGIARPGAEKQPPTMAIRIIFFCAGIVALAIGILGGGNSG